MKACEICGLDVAYHFAGSPLETESVQGPLILGHEFTGEIVELGSIAKNNGSLVVGDSVMGNPVRECGACKYCVSSQANICLDSAQNALRSGKIKMGSLITYTFKLEERIDGI